MVVVPLRAMLTGVRVHVSPVEGETVALNDNVPTNPWSPLAVIVEVAELPTIAITDVGLAPSVKSCIVNATVAAWVRPLLVAVTVTTYAPCEPEHDRVAIADVVAELRAIPAGMEQVNPLGGETEYASATVPVYPSSPANVTVEAPKELEVVVTAVGLADIVKSWTV